MEVTPTTNMEAYDFFLRGNTYWYTKTSKEGNMKAASMYQRAVDLDPTFGMAYARLSIVHAVLYQESSWDPTPERRELARTTLDQALALIPDHPEVHFAQGIFYDWCLNDVDNAIKEFEISFGIQPSSGEVAQHMAKLYADKGNWNKAEFYFEKAYELEPDIIGNASWLAGYNFLNWNFKRSEELYRISIQLAPESASAYKWLARTRLYGNGDLTGSLEIIEDGILNTENPEDLISEKWYIQFAMGDYQAALKTVQTYYRDLSRSFYKSQVYYQMGDKANFILESDSAMAFLIPALEMESTAAMANDRLALLRALKGDFESAISTGRKAIELEPIEKYAVFGPLHILRLAEIYTLAGDDEQAIELLRGLLKPPSVVTSWSVKLDRYLSPLLDDPRLKPLLPTNPAI
ncbi:tetratricopeptide repeat protein [bacterium]|nr:tetratricopeptide repeat protein [bacterium]